MKICLVYNVFPGISGETVFFDSMRKHLVPALQDEGYEVDCLPVRHMAFPVLRDIEFYSRIPLLLHARAALRDSAPDAVHFLNSSLAPAGHGLDCRKIATVHLLGDSYQSLPPAEGLLQRAAGSAFRAYAKALDSGPLRGLDAVAACTPFQAGDLIGTYSLEPAKVRVIPPGIDPSPLLRAPERDLRSEFGCERILVYAGRLHERSKGVSYAIRAMEHLQGCKLLVMGDGPDLGRYRALARRLRHGEDVVFLGTLPPEEKCSIQKSADACVVPSLRDVFCTVFAESLACGVPVAALDMPFWKGLYDGAAVFTERTGEAFARGIEEALLGKTIRRGLELARRYDAKETVASYLALYEEMDR